MARMTSRRAGIAAISVGLIIVVWAWLGYWPLAAPVYGPASDYAGLHGLSFAVAIAGVFILLVGSSVAIAGRGGPEHWNSRSQSDDSD
jgi:hypothetical protein